MTAHDERAAAGLSSLVLGEVGFGRGGVIKSRRRQRDLMAHATQLDLRASSPATQIMAVYGGTLVRFDRTGVGGRVNTLDPRVDPSTCGARPAPHTSNDTTEEES